MDLTNHLGSRCGGPPGGGGRPSHLVPSFSSRLRSAIAEISTGVVKALCTPPSPPEPPIGDEVLLAAVNAGEDVILATAGGPDLQQVVRDYAARLGEHASAASIIVLRIDAQPSSESRSRRVRLFGRPYEMADTPVIVAAALGASIFPTFAQPDGRGRSRIHVHDPCRVGDRSEMARQRTAQRLAWALERFARSVPAYEWKLRNSVDRVELPADW